jgi:hypothetical protein
MPKCIARLGRQRSWRRRRAPQAVPVPQEMAAPVTKESKSGSDTSVDTGTFMYLAWPP